MRVILILILVLTTGCCLTQPDIYSHEKETLDPFVDPAYGFDFEEISPPYYHTKFRLEEIRLAKARGQCFALSNFIMVPTHAALDTVLLLIPTGH